MSAIDCTVIALRTLLSKAGDATRVDPTGPQAHEFVVDDIAFAIPRPGAAPVAAVHGHLGSDVVGSPGAIERLYRQRSGEMRVEVPGVAVGAPAPMTVPQNAETQRMGELVGGGAPPLFVLLRFGGPGIGLRLQPHAARGREPRARAKQARAGVGLLRGVMHEHAYVVQDPAEDGTVRSRNPA